ncbi:MAG: nitrite reductase small subunit NirD [Pseudohongiellaceae bacterium]|nr:nitrite reductase small subunit NirD [Pseudohongiellaceae bacterium]
MNTAEKIASQDIMDTKNSWVDICDISDLAENIGQCALVNGKQVAVFCVSGTQDVYAIDNFDPFSNANVISRGILGDLEGKLVVASPIYKQHFELATGQCLEDESVKLDTYKVRVNDGRVQIES